jgi:CDP-paratose 2-epimerase
MKKLLITGGAGFIGVNTARYFIKKGWFVVILDNFSRNGTRENISNLKSEHEGKFEVVEADIVSDIASLVEVSNEVDVVLHLAAQVAVTTSITNPRGDFEINALGSFNVLEAVRLSSKKPVLLYSSSNKVYGSLEHLHVKERETRYEFVDNDIQSNGVSEKESLDFHSPYGCSKGAADQYVHDYSRIYGLKTVVLRQSCIYGPHQFGVEDQGWVAWFTIAALLGKPLTIYGDGKQVRDILHVEDLARLYHSIVESIDRVDGQVFNVGGGPKNTLSLIELLDMLGKRYDKEIIFTTAPVRAGDQPIFVADIGKLKDVLGWAPEYNLTSGFESMADWIDENRATIELVLGEKKAVLSSSVLSANVMQGK